MASYSSDEELVRDIVVDEQLVQPVHEDLSVRIEDIFNDEDVPAAKYPRKVFTSIDFFSVDILYM